MPPRSGSKIVKRTAPSKRDRSRRTQKASSEERNSHPVSFASSQAPQPSADTMSETPAEQTSPASPWRLRLAIDIGTTFTKASYQFFNHETQISTPVYHVSWDGPHQYQTPSVLAYRNGELHWGQQVETLLKNHKIDEASVMRQAKLALHKYEDVGEASKVRSKVVHLLAQEGKDIFELVADYMSSLVVAAQKHIQRTNDGKKYNSSTLPLHLSVSVPQVWQPSSNVSLCKAAKTLGVHDLSIVGEALCVAATVLEKELNSSGSEQWLKAGDRVIVADLGGGTGDFVLIELCNPISADPRFGMSVVLPASGGLCGAVFINHNFINYLTNTHFDEEGLNRLAGEMGFDPDTFLARASIAFEDVKRSFPDDSDYYTVIVEGKLKYRESWTIRLTKHQMESFFDPVVQQIDEQIDAMVADNPAAVKCLILSGGLGKSVYVIGHMERRFAATQTHVLYPVEDHKGVVPEGALLRYTPGSIKPFGHDWSLCVVRAEDFDPEVHLDAVADGNLPIQDFFDKSIYIVEDRCMWIKNAVTGKTREVWKVHYEPVRPGKGVELRAEVFGTTSTNIEDHEALYLPYTETLRPGIMKFYEIKFEMSESTLQAWEPVAASDGRMCYEIFSCVVIRFDNDQIRLGLKVLLPGQVPTDADGNLADLNDAALLRFDDDDFETIWDRKFNHVALETDPAARVSVSTAANAGASSTPSSRQNRARKSSMFVHEDDSGDEDYVKPAKRK